jgi:hypothetical protein
MHGESTQALCGEQAVQTGGSRRPSLRLLALARSRRVRGVTEERTKGSLLGGLSDTVRLS